MSKRYDPLWAEVDLGRIENNIGLIAKTAGVPLYPVVKANAYGHGAVMVAKTVSALDSVAAVCVMTIAEARELRRAGITSRIILLGGVAASQGKESAALLVEPVISDADGLAIVIKQTPPNTRTLIHLKLNTGMNRLGVDQEEALSLYKKAAASKKIQIAGVMTHFADSGSTGPMTNEQIVRFDDFVGAIKGGGYDVPVRHAANSAALFCHPHSRYDAVRPGLGIYGIQGFAGVDCGLAPALSLYAKIIAMRTIPKGTPVSYGMTWVASGKRTVALAAVGYADGYSTRFSNRARAIIDGKIRHQIGTVCMDNSLFDVTGSAIKKGDAVTLIGKVGNVQVTVSELARLIEVIPYEVLCGIGRRAPRIYKKGTRTVGVVEFF